MMTKAKLTTVLVTTTSLGHGIWWASGTVSPVGQLKRPLLRLCLPMALIAFPPTTALCGQRKHAREPKFALTQIQSHTIGATLVVPRVTMLQAQFGRCFDNPYPSQQQRRCERGDIVVSSVSVLHPRGIHNIFRTNTDKRKHQRCMQPP